MPSAIDDTKPVQGPATTQSVRANFTAAKNEISTLQTQVSTAQTTANTANTRANNSVLRTGDMMSGGLTMPAQAGPPATPPAINQAITRGYLDDRINEFASGTGYVPEAPTGGSMYVRGGAQWREMYGLSLDSNRIMMSGEVNFWGGYLYLSGDTRVTNQMYISGDLYISTNNFYVSGGAHYIDNWTNWNNRWGNVSFCGSAINIYGYGTGWSRADMYIRGNLSLSGGDMYMSGRQIYLTPNNGLWIYNSDVYIGSRVYMSGGASFTNEVYLSGDTRITGSCYLSGDTRITNSFYLSGGAHYLYQSGDWFNGQANFCGSTINAYSYRYFSGYWREHREATIYAWQIYLGGGDIYISGATYFNNQVVMSGWHFGVMSPMYISGYNQTSLTISNQYTPNGVAIQVDAGDVRKPGGGVWSGTSDARTKTDIRDYEAGLKEIMQLDAQSFRYNGRGRIQETGKRFVGIPAEQCQMVMPEMVEKVRGKLEYDDEEETDILQVNATPLIYASLNAIKEIAKSLEKLNDRLTALEEKTK